MIGAPQKQKILIDGYNMAYVTAGDPANPAVLFIHGWGSHLGIWERTIKALQDRYYCVAMDIIGLGDSDKPEDADYSIPNQARQIVMLADALGITSFAVVGHSRGGQLALQIAANTAPERITTVIDVDGVVTGNVGAYQFWVLGSRLLLGRYVPGLYSLSRQLYTRYHELARIEGMPWYADMRRVDHDNWEQDLAYAIQPGAHVSNLKTALSIRQTDLSGDLKRIRAPLLVIHGDHDDCVPTQQGILVAQQAQDAHLKILPNCGHFPMYEKYRAYLRAISSFLDAHLSK